MPDSDAVGEPLRRLPLATGFAAINAARRRRVPDVLIRVHYQKVFQILFTGPFDDVSH